MTGTITTTDVGTAATVDSVAVTLTNGTTSYLLNKYSGTSSLKIVGLELTIPLDVISEIEASASPNAFVLFDNDADQYTGAVPGAPFFLWNLTPPLDPSVPGDRIGLSPMIFGTLQQTTLQTPEPASLTVWALLGLVGVFYLRRRSAKA